MAKIKTNAAAVAETTTAVKTRKKVLTVQDLGGKDPKVEKAELENELRKISRETGAPRLAELARGIKGGQAPQSAKALQQARDKVAASTKADKAAESAKAKATKPAPTRKTDAVAAPKGDDKRTITIVQKDFVFGRTGSARNDSWLACVKAKTVADYAVKGGKLKYLPRWVAAGAIKLG